MLAKLPYDQEKLATVKFCYNVKKTIFGIFWGKLGSVHFELFTELNCKNVELHEKLAVFLHIIKKSLLCHFGVSFPVFLYLFCEINELLRKQLEIFSRSDLKVNERLKTERLDEMFFTM